MNAAAWGVIGAFVGALASIATTWLTTRHTASLHRQQVIDERMERHRDFQQETLIALQEAIHEYLRITAEGHFEDLKAYADGVEWGRSLMSKEVSDGGLLVARRTVILIERVANDELRTNLKKMHKSLVEVPMMRSKSEAEKQLGLATRMVTEILEQLGVELRRQYE